MKLLFFILSIVISMTNSAFAVKAVDFSDLTSKYAFQCTKRNGYERVIIKGYFEAWGRNPGGSIDRNFLQNYKNAQAAGYTYIDVYMFPCTGRPTCKTPQKQVNDLVQFVNTSRVIVQTVWLDVEVDLRSGNWKLGPAKNRKVLQDFRNAWKSTNWKFGIYSSQFQWQTIVGDKNWVLDSSLPLWYSLHDNRPDLKYFRPFGGWKRGTVKQYVGNVRFCGAKFDLNAFKDNKDSYCKRCCLDYCNDTCYHDCYSSGDYCTSCSYCKYPEKNSILWQTEEELF